MLWPLRFALNRIIRSGHLCVTDAAGTSFLFGDHSGAPQGFAIADRRTELALAVRPSLGFAEGYMDGRIRLTHGTLVDLVALFLANRQAQRSGAIARVVARLTRPRNSAFAAGANARAHYDLDQAFYALFLDENWQYSCAYFDRSDADIHAAQRAKLRHIAAKLAIRPHHSVLDIGSGWGGLGLYLARATGARVRGITLSPEQQTAATRRARAAGLAHAVGFHLEDYRAVEGQFDRVVSVGMFEHVGSRNYHTYFAQIRRCLATRGVALLHTIGRLDGPSPTNPFIAKYIFPGGELPALSQILPAIEQAGLIVTDIEILRGHYAETLQHWRTRLLARREEAVALKGERFVRMWELYFAACEAAFRADHLAVFQIQLARRIDSLPITRDYIAAAERVRTHIEEQPHRTPQRRTPYPRLKRLAHAPLKRTKPRLRMS